MIEWLDQVFNWIQGDSPISFPGLGLQFNPPQGFSIGSMHIQFYGVIIAMGLILAVIYGLKRRKEFGLTEDDLIDGVLWIVPFAVICARLYFVFFTWDYYKAHPDQIIAIWNGGLAIYGGVIGAALGIVVYCKCKKLKLGALLDLVAIGFLIGQAIGRWGNFFNREAFGEYTNSLFAMQLPVEAVRSADITEKMWKNIVEIEGVQFIQAHPTFLYESLWNVCVLAFMLWWMKRKKFEGEIFLIYLLGYGVGRSWIEGLRTDPLLIPGTSVPVSQVLALVLVITSAVLMYVKGKKSKDVVTSEESDVASEESDVASEESSVEGE